MAFLDRYSPRAVGIGAAVVTVTIWTAFIVVARASAGRTLTSFDIAWLRFVGASIVMVPWGFWLLRKRVAETGARGASWLGLSPYGFRLTAVLGTIAGLGYALIAYTGFFFAPAAHASVLMPGSLPLWTALLSAIFLAERITPARAGALALIVLGDVVVGGASLWRALASAGSGTSEVWKGDLLFMSGAMCWATYTVIVRKHRLPAVPATIAISVFCLLTYVPVYAALAWGGVIASKLHLAPWREIAFQTLMQGVGSVVISGVSFTLMIERFGPIRATMITALVPGLSAFAAVIFLGEPLGWNLVLGLACVTAGILLGVRASRQVAIKTIAI